jgi:holo-[acyl-carrier protein] synthase
VTRAVAATPRVGVDLVSIAEVASSVERFGERYLNRLFTAQELASCARAPAETAASLAARFAAKEAVIKVLRPVGPHPEWRSIEVIRGPEGACDIRLHGTAARLAEDAGIRELGVSLTHEAGMAAAVVIGLCQVDPDCVTVH